MKKFITVLVFIAIGLNLAVSQNLKPYTIGAKTTGTVTSVKALVKSALESNDFSILGQYQPANDANRWVIIVGCSELNNAVKKVGGTTGFALALRVAITKESGKIIISYTTPEYWGNAYFQQKYEGIQSSYSKISGRLKATLGKLGTDGGKMFGSIEGLSKSDLQGYHYMFGMPYFEDNIKLKSFSSYDEAVRTIDNNFSTGMNNLSKVYSIALPSKKLKLYGVALKGADGESSFLPTIDTSNPRHTAFLPYELLVHEGNVYMLHGRYRIALSFPDLSMGTFMKIVSTPDNIRSLIETTTK